MSELVTLQDAPLGSVDWVQQSGGRLTFAERFSILLGALPGLREGLELRRRARKTDRATSFGELEPPDTPMVVAAREYLTKHADISMVNHCFRTAFWTLTVLHQEQALTSRSLETTWVAALLHDVGLEVPPARGDFTQGGVEILRSIAQEVRWDEEQVHEASNAITSNLSMHVDAGRLGKIAWAMNVGGIGDIGFGPHRAIMSRADIAELEARFPRTGFRKTALRLIAEEATRVPGGRFALFRPIFWLVLR